MRLEMAFFSQFCLTQNAGKFGKLQGLFYAIENLRENRTLQWRLSIYPVIHLSIYPSTTYLSIFLGSLIFSQFNFGLNSTNLSSTRRETITHRSLVEHF
jgi:hypothetical protein